MPQHVPPPLLDAVARPGQGPAPATVPATPRRIVFLAHRDLGNPAAAWLRAARRPARPGPHRARPRRHAAVRRTGRPSAYRVVSAGSALGHYVGARSAFARRIGTCDLLVEVCNGMPYLAPLWHRGPTVCLVNHVHTDLWDMRFPTPVARAGRKLEHWALSRAYRDHLMIAVSPSTAGALRALGVPDRRIRVVHNGVQEPSPQGERSATPLFVALGLLRRLQAHRSAAPALGAGPAGHRR